MSNWKTEKFGALYEIPSRNGLSKPSKVRGTGYKMINMGELFANDWIYDIKMELVPLSDAEKEKAKVEEGDLLFARQSLVAAGAGKCSIVLAVSDMTVFESHIIRVRLNREIADPMFYYYYFRSPMSPMKSIIQHCVQAGIKGSDLEKLEVSFPPLNEQKQIASILSTLDEKIKNNCDINDNLAQQIDAVLLAFMDDNDATLVKLGDYLYIKGRIGWKGLKKSEYLSQSGYRIINGETLTKAGIDWSKAGYISEERYVESPEIMLKVGDILLSKDGTIGKIGYVDNLDLPTSVASGIFVIRNNKPDVISTTFIFYLLKSKLFESFIAARTEGSVIPHLYQKDFMEFEFPLPSAERMAEFEGLTEPMFSQIINNLNENKALASLRDSLLPKLMSGKLGVSSIDL